MKKQCDFSQLCALIIIDWGSRGDGKCVFLCLIQNFRLFGLLCQDVDKVVEGFT